MLAWALRTVLVWGLAAGGVYYFWQERPFGEAGRRETAAAPKTAPSAVAANRLVYRADKSGHFLVEAAVNGAPVRFLVDTGASFVSLTPDDARAAGITRGELDFSARAQTANGVARIAKVTLRDVRLDQLDIEDVPAVVMETAMPVSLLGMSFLKRLDGYEIRDGQLVISW
jgi:aspartyl protease family protein